MKLGNESEPIGSKRHLTKEYIVCDSDQFPNFLPVYSLIYMSTSSSGMLTNFFAKRVVNAIGCTYSIWLVLLKCSFVKFRT